MSTPEKNLPTWTCQDPAVDLEKVIPIRLFGDGAEAQRILVQPTFFHMCNGSSPFIFFRSFELTLEENKSMKCSLSNFPAVKAVARWITGY